ncbi:AIPR family protein [uncultured Vagococcus sp.]|uniref:AIPR family protein n=1 Tax=uncultured Vagococcus sp. TaxID=189676 RepID=UPI0028D1B2F8|nr:AIPR family protein [uncultured Vagococcus sp.]
MGVLELTQIKNRLIQEYSQFFPDLDTKDIKDASLSKSLAAYAICVLFPESNRDIVIDNLVDGSDDNGIDLIYYDSNTNKLCFVQSKYNHKGNSEPSLGDIKKFLSGIQDLLSMKFDKFNDNVNKRKDEIISILNTDGLKYKAVLVYTATNLSKHSLTEFNEFKASQNNANEVADFEIINQKRLHNSLRAESQRIDLDIPLTYWGKYNIDNQDNKTNQAYYGQVFAETLCEWWDEYGDSLSTLNIRKLLGETDINTEMRDTIEIEPENFWYFNNGITLVCDEVAKKSMFGASYEAGVFACKNISIVNGAQTLGTIGRYGVESEANREKLKLVKVQLRIISTYSESEEEEVFYDEAFLKKVTKTNNRQNQITPRDFLAQEPTQRRIESQLAIEGITYHLMREEHELETESSFTVREATRALSFAKDIESTFLAKTNITNIYSDLNHLRYKKIFNDSVTGIYVWNCILIQREINKQMTSITISLTSDKEKSILTYSKEVVSKIVFDDIRIDKISDSMILDENQILNFSIEKRTRKIVNKLLESSLFINTDKDIPTVMKNNTFIKKLYQSIEEKLDIGLIKVEEFDILTLDKLSVLERKIFEEFSQKIISNEYAYSFLKTFLTDFYDSSDHSTGYQSNIHIYSNSTDESLAVNKFLFRIAFYKQMIISFDYNRFHHYRSLYLQDKDVEKLIIDKTNNTLKLIVNSQEDLDNAQKLFSVLKKHKF